MSYFLFQLDVSGNPITEGLEVLKSCPNLVSLNLSGNKLATIADLAPLASLENLSSLEMGDCDLVSVDGYRKEVFSILPNLKVLDGLDRDGVEELNERFTGGVANGPKNGHVITANDEGDEEEEEEEDDDEGQEEDEDEDDEEEDIGISALQGSKDLEDDEEDYVPGDFSPFLCASFFNAPVTDLFIFRGEGEDDAEDEEEDDDEGDEDEGEGENVEDEIANLSGSGVTDTRRAQKRPADDSDAVGVSEAKVAATEDN